MRARFFAVALLSSVVARPLAWATPATMALGEVRVGQVGECHTVFVGRRIDRMPFEVRGVLPDFLGPKRDLLLIRLQGEQAEFTGVASGMSGSPCLIDGRVVGALSYSFAVFNKEPIAGVTPIGDMLELLRLPEEQLPWRGVAMSDTPPRLGAATAWDEDWRALQHGQPSRWPPTMGGEMGARPIAAAVSVGGGHPGVWQRFAPYLQSHGFALAAGAGGRGKDANASTTTADAPAFVPGDSIAAVMVHGDVHMGATGTVSWVDGANVLAFGHPFMGLGPVSAPMARSHIVQILASAMHSQKMPITDEVVGEVTQDRLFAIAGRVGAAPSMVPVSGALHAHGRRHAFSFCLARDAFWTPRMLAMALSSALAGQLEPGERGTMHTEGHIVWADGSGAKPLRVHAVQAGDRNEELAVHGAFVVAKAVAQLWQAPDQWPLTDLRIEVQARFVPEVHDERIEMVHLADTHVAPGQYASLAIELSRQGQPNHTVQSRVQVPSSYLGESLTVYACDADGLDKLAGAFDVNQGQQRFGERLHALRERHAPGAVYVQLVDESARTHRHLGQRLGPLPVTAASLLAPAAMAKGAWVGPAEVLPRQGAVHGCASAPLRVRRPVGLVTHALPRP